MAQKDTPDIVVIFGDDIGIFPPTQGADTLGTHKAIETAMRKMETRTAAATERPTCRNGCARDRVAA